MSSLCTGATHVIDNLAGSGLRRVLKTSTCVPLSFNCALTKSASVLSTSYKSATKHTSDPEATVTWRIPTYSTEFRFPTSLKETNDFEVYGASTKCFYAN